MTDIFQKSTLPGKHERHLIRRADCPLFGQRHQPLTAEALTQAQRQDHEELVDFIHHLRSLASQALNLDQKVDSDVIIKLKEKLDEAYEMAARLADDQSDNKAVILHLIDAIMSTISKNSAGDTLAFKELGKERRARATHFALLENTLIADLIDPEGAILADELVPTLFSTTPKIMEAALVIFDSEQIKEIHQSATDLLAELKLEAEYQDHQNVLKKSLAEIKLSTMMG